jgi:hypothetical protein
MAHGKGEEEQTGLFFYSKYKGQFANGMRHGEGEQTWPDGRKYKGQFVNDKKQGEGEHTWPDGMKYKGQYFTDKRHGEGEHTWSDGRKYKGTECDFYSQVTLSKTSKMDTVSYSGLMDACTEANGRTGRSTARERSRKGWHSD